MGGAVKAGQRAEHIKQQASLAGLGLAQGGEEIRKNGRVLPGTVGKWSSEDGVLQVGVADILGSDLVDGGSVLVSPQLFGGENWYKEITASLAVPNSSSIDFRLTGSILDARIPAYSGASRLDLGEIGAWTVSRTEEVGIETSLPGNRIRYVGRFGWSDIRDSEAVGFESSHGQKLYRYDDREAGRAESHRIDATLLDATALKMSAYAFRRSASPGFVWNRPTLADGAARTVAEIRSRFDRYDMTFGNQGRETTEIGAKMRLGPVIFSLARRERESEFTQREMSKLGLSLDLESYRVAAEEGSLAYLLPTDVRFGFSDGRVTSRRSDDNPDDRETGVDFGVEWSWDSASTAIEFWSSRIVGREADGGPADSDDFGLDLSQDFYGKGWSVSTFVSVGSSGYDGRGDRYADTDVGGGAYLTLRPKDGPRFRTGVTAFNGSSIYPDDEYELQWQRWSWSNTLDFSDYLKARVVLGDPFLRVSYYLRHVETDGSDSGRSGSLDHALALVTGISF